MFTTSSSDAEGAGFIPSQGTEVASQGALEVKHPPANDTRDACSIPGLSDPLEEGMAVLSSILACGILWTEAPGSWDRRVGHD